MKIPENLPIKYNLFWSGEIVQQALESSPRAWEIFMRWSELKEWQLSRILASGNQDWYKCRTFVHGIAKALLRHEYSPLKLETTIQMLRYCWSHNADILPEWLFHQLTVRFDGSMLEEQVFRGGTRGAQPPLAPDFFGTEVTSVPEEKIHDDQGEFGSK